MKNLAIIFITALTISNFVHANELTCESSNLLTSAPNLEQIASNLAKLRLQIYQMPNTGEKSRADQEFKGKYEEFENLAGDRVKAKNLFRSKMNLAKLSHLTDKSREIERKENEQKERETGTIDHMNMGSKMRFHEILPGAFQMGIWDKVNVEITKSFAMMSTLVTQIMWARIQEANGEKDPKILNPSFFKHGAKSETVFINGSEVSLKPNHPVEQVSWPDVIQFIRILNALSKSDDPSMQSRLSELIPGHEKGEIYDLPTDAQWEFVMRDRGNANGKYFDRDDQYEVNQYAWGFSFDNIETHAVGTRKPRIIDGNAFYDLEGNVREWTKDYFTETVTGGIDPQGPENGKSHVSRGGSTMHAYFNMRSGARWDTPTELREKGLGFRLVRTRP